MSLFKESRVCVCVEVFIIAASPTVWIVLVPCWQTVANPEHSRIGNWMDSIKPLWSGLEELCLLWTHTHIQVHTYSGVDVGTQYESVLPTCWASIWCVTSCPWLDFASFQCASVCVHASGMAWVCDMTFHRHFWHLHTKPILLLTGQSPLCVCVPRQCIH